MCAIVAEQDDGDVEHQSYNSGSEGKENSDLLEDSDYQPSHSSAEDDEEDDEQQGEDGEEGGECGLVVLTYARALHAFLGDDDDDETAVTATLTCVMGAHCAVPPTTHCGDRYHFR